MAISRMNMERQMRNMGGIMELEEPRQGFFLGKIVRKAKKAVKKVVKSPLGNVALGAAALKFGGPGIAKLLGRDPTGFLSGRFLGDGGIFSAARGLFDQGNFLAPLVRDKTGAFSLGRAALTGLGATALAAPFFMGGDEEEVDEGVPVTGIQPMVANIRQQARDYYQDPTKSALYFMPPKSAVKFGGAFAGGGLADIPRGGYENGKMVKADLSEDPNYKGWLKLYEKNPEVAMMNENAQEYLRFKNSKAEGGIMDLGGMEKDYREGGFVPIGAEERADDVPARLSKNEFVFTADAVRNAGGGDIDKGAEVMQNMMDNLEAGGMISEESQGKENPAQAMFDQAQMLEGRLA